MFCLPALCISCFHFLLFSAELSRSGFLQLLKTEGAAVHILPSKKELLQREQQAETQGLEPITAPTSNWRVLDEGYMTKGATMKDWDKDNSSSEEDEEQVEQEISD